MMDYRSKIIEYVHTKKMSSLHSESKTHNTLKQYARYTQYLLSA